MKKTLLALTLIGINILAFSQKIPTTKPGSTGAIIINVPDLADPASKKWHEAYTN